MTEWVLVLSVLFSNLECPEGCRGVNDAGARFVGRVVLWGAAAVVSVGSLSGCQLDVGLLTWSSLTPIDPLICSPLRASDDR